MARFLIYLMTFAACLTISFLTVFYLGCMWAVVALILSLFLAERVGLLR